ncbi:MAG: hypothetical protein QG574_4448 [Cyanobacteriota bacterium erpe_2018_sw_21hr_WHONDRS-SW48-000092_B_bin.40]|jgi:hypothetical protein|nr:hypothetical protein [Cyanobacteriota bacterium erpe_2018_sw_21hr_WHONDRS-SW48-000092_B_bin.40]
MSQTATATERESVMDTALLDEVVHWVKTLTAVGVSPDCAATLTTEILLATSESADEFGEYGEDMEEFDEE